MSVKTLVVIGSGPGIGVHTASLFASHNFTHIALLARTAARLQTDASSVSKSASSQETIVKTYPVDVADASALQSTLQQVEVDLGPPEVVLFNAARIAPTTIGDTTPEYILEDFKITNIALYVAATWAVPHLTRLASSTQDPAVKPSFFVSGSSLHTYPLPPLFSLSMMKAAQTNFAASLAHTVRSKGVHVCTLLIGGLVSEDDVLLNPSGIANEFWRIYGQDRKNWEESVEMGDIRERTKGMF